MYTQHLYSLVASQVVWYVLWDPSPGSFRHVAADQVCKCHVLEPASGAREGGCLEHSLLPCTGTMIDRCVDAYLVGGGVGGGG